MAENQQTLTVRVPLELNTSDRRVIANRIVDHIFKRTKKGLDKNNKAFKGYSTSYKESKEFKIAGKTSKVNLTLTGDMLTDLEVLNVGVPGFITIGFESGTSENDRASWQRNNTQSGFPKRDFLGISANDLNKIIRSYIAENPIVSEEESAASSLAESIVNNLFKSSNG